MALDSNRDTSFGTDLLRLPQFDFRKLVDLSAETVLLIGLDGAAAYISPACEQLLGWSPDKLSGQLGNLVHTGEQDREAGILHRILTGTGDQATALSHSEIQLRSASGTMVWADVTTHLVRDEAGNAYAFAVYFRDIARRKELEGLLEAANQTDPLTGLMNRRAFEEALQREWAVSLREKTHTSLIKVSLDRFEALTENFGPGPAADCLLKVSRALSETARRPADIAARTASSEFSLLFPRTHEMGAETISAYIQVAIQDLAIPNPENSAGNGVVTASVGAASAFADQTGISESSEFLIAAAEDCVFQARQEGGNRVKTVAEYPEH